ncbi:MAG TPA: hypothetical protein VMU54_08820, partial [Planctomycetota bacterium]|nr:hypothetical protein [Planctomycetota bacterium]
AMRHLIMVVPLLALWSCASAGTAEEFQWSVECPKSVDKGGEFTFTVHTIRPSGPEVAGVTYHYQILWTAGSGSPLRHKGSSAALERVHARMVPGPATMVVTCENKQGLDVKVAEATFEVK